MPSFTRRTGIALMGSAAFIPSAFAAGGADADFDALSKRWLESFLALQPITATYVGDHRFDGQIDDMSAAGRAARTARWRMLLQALGRIERTQLSRNNQVDAAILKNQLEYMIWDDERLQSWAWDAYGWSQTAGNALYFLMARDFAPMATRLKSAAARMKRLPLLLEQMRGSLVPARVPPIHAATAAKQNGGVIDIVDSMILPHAHVLALADQAELKTAADLLRGAVKLHQKWLDETLVPNAKGDFRLGAALFDEKLAFTLESDLSRKEIRARAHGALKQTRAQMHDLAKRVLVARKTPNVDAMDEQATIQAALDLCYADRPAPDRLVETSRGAVAMATKFVRDKNIITLPDAPVRIITMPRFQQGVAVAYCDPPGPLDKKLATFYAVSPIPEGWSRKQTDSFLREYNRRAIADIAVHEAMPGHYVQLWHANKYPSMIRAVLWSGSFVEGWAAYAENMMAEEGFYQADPLYRLAQLKVWLRSITNAILDQAIHCDGMSEKDAMKLMTEAAFQEESEAAGKWTRARLSSAQLSTYFVGRSEHDAIRKRAQEKGGFNPKHYHDTMLSFGSPPARFAEALMFGDPIT
ncbi:MAG: hypothetical protein BGN85_06565 [Alphaproteobacteria bacterium 64-11]|nr:DUF885 domain-containing protein [Alphaproteobacteria bacterium]OJU13436.1 MAG: hypothetical protein BGN85_06565 [Alphaproteobacteria bacterium 64-11]